MGFVESQVVFQANHTSGCTPLGVVISVTSPSAGSISSYAWTITTPSGNVLTASTATYTAIFSQPGAYDVSLTINGNQTQTLTDYITVNALPVADFIVDDTEGCYPHCVQFTDTSTPGSAPITSWSWDFGNGTSSVQQHPENCYATVGNFTPVFSVSDANGCFAVKTIPGLIHVENNFPVAAFSPSSQLTCNPPVDITMTNNSTGNSELTSTWDFGDGIVQTVAGTIPVTHTYAASGNYTACLTVTNAMGCQKQKCLPITIFQTPMAQFTVSDTQQCLGEPFVFTSTTTPTPTSFQWDFNGDGIVDNTNASASFAFSQTGIFTPSLKVIYSNTCYDTVQGNPLEVVDGVHVSFDTQDTASCLLPYDIHLLNTTTGSGDLTYQWWINDVAVGTDEQLNYTLTDYGLWDLKLKATSSLGCIAELEIPELVITQEPEVYFENGLTICTDQAVPVFNVYVNSVDSVIHYLWDFTGDGITDAEGFNPNFSYTVPGIYTITLTIETASGCTASRSSDQEINVLDEVQANLTSSTTMTCAGESITFCVDQQPGNTYSWNFYDGSGWVVMPLNESCIQHDYADTGYFDLSLTVFNGACNVVQTLEDFIYVTPPVAQFEYIVHCDDLTVEVNDISIEADYVTWDFGDGSPLVTGTSTTTHNYDSPGEYVITITAYNDDLGCPDTQSATVKVSDPNPEVSFAPTSGCPPLNVTVTPQVFNPTWDIQVSNGDIIHAQWSEAIGKWQVNYTHNGNASSYLVAGIDSVFMPEIIIEDQGYFDVTVQVTDINGCTASLFYEDVLHVASNPDFATFEAVTLDLCNSVSIQYQPTLTDLTSWLWTFSDGTTSTDENPIYALSPPYNYGQPLSATLTATDAQGCESTVTQTLNVILPPVPNFTTASITHCILDDVAFVNTSAAPAGTTYSWDFGDGVTQVSQHASHAYTANGNYQVCLTATSPSGCQRTKCTSSPVKVLNPIPTFTYSSSVNNCLFGVQFQNTTAGTSSSVLWDFGDEQAGTGGTAYHTYAIGVFDVTMSVTNQYGCTSSITEQDILHYGNQIGPFDQLLDSASCAPFDITLSAFNTADTYFDYFWDFNDGSGDPSGSTITTHTYLQPGTYCPSVIMTDPNGCAKLISCTQPIVVDEFVMSYQIPPYICAGDTLEVLIDTGESFHWNGDVSLTNGTLPNQFYLHPSSNHTYYLTGHLADCERTDTVNVTVRSLPQVSLSLPAGVCFGDEAIVLNTGLPLDSSAYYTIDGSVATVFSPSQNAGVSYEVGYHYTDEFQCSNTATQSVFIYPLPVIDFPDYPPICESEGVFVLNEANPTGGEYRMNEQLIETFDPSNGWGAFDVSYHYVDNHGCESTAWASLNVYPIPGIDVSFDNICLNEPLVIHNQTSMPDGTTVISSHWEMGSGIIDSNYEPQAHYWDDVGIYPIEYTAIGPHGCTATWDSTFHVLDVPHAAFNPTFACQGTELAVVNQSTINHGFVSTAHWVVENQGITTQLMDTLWYIFAGYGDLPMTLRVTSDMGCSDTLSQTIQVRPSPVINMEYDLACHGTETNFNANSSIPFGGIVSKSWNFGDNHQQEIGEVVDNLYDSPGTYLVTFTALSNLGCVATATEEIVVRPLPEVDFALELDEVCAGSPFSFYDLSVTEDGSDIVEWTWWMDNHPVSFTQNPTLRTLEIGDYSITLTVTTEYGCTNDSTAYLALNVWPRPDAGFVSEDEISMAQPIVNIINTASDDVTLWQYEFGDGQFAVFEEGSHLYENWGVYYITQYVTNTFGCKDTAVKQITVNPDLAFYIPNAFTPDGNGHNEVYLPVIYGSEVVDYHFRLFNRWGESVFYTHDPLQGWDGTMNGVEMPQGVYNWTIEYRPINRDDVIHKQGSVNLIR